MILKLDDTKEFIVEGSHVHYKTYLIEPPVCNINPPIGEASITIRFVDNISKYLANKLVMYEKRKINDNSL